MTPSPTSGLPKPPNILVAEDHELSRETLCESLFEMGFNVLAVPDGLQAVEISRSETFDLILMDLQMPVMDGISSTRVIRAWGLNSQTWIVALTANDTADYRQSCRQAGFDGLIAKGTGTQFDSLFETIQTILRTPRDSYCDGHIPAIRW